MRSGGTRRRTLPSWDDFFRDRGVRSILTNIGLWTVLGLTALPMDNYAHGGGFVVGAAAAWILTDRQAGGSTWLVFAAAFAGLFVAALRRGTNGHDFGCDRLALHEIAARQDYPRAHRPQFQRDLLAETGGRTGHDDVAIFHGLGLRA